MRTYVHGDRRSWYFVLGNGTREFEGWPIDICVTSYGWVSDGSTNKDRSRWWADSAIEIGPFRFVWQFHLDDKRFYITYQFEFGKK